MKSVRRSLPWWFAAAGSLAGASLWAHAVQARACTTDADCPRGFACQGGPTSDSIPPFPATEPPPGAGGPAHACVSLQCRTDADCGDGTRCELDVETVCTTLPNGTTSCSPGNMCVPAWQARCKADSECGPGFTCSGSDGYYECAPPSQAKVPSYAMATSISCGALLPPIPPGGLPVNLCDASTCSSITWSTCIAQKPVSCRTDADCLPTWTCGCIGDACSTECIPPNSDLAPVNPTSSPSGSPTGGSADAAALAMHPGARSAPIPSSPQGGCQFVAGDPATPWAVLLGLCFSLAWRGRRGR